MHARVDVLSKTWLTLLHSTTRCYAKENMKHCYAITSIQRWSVKEHVYARRHWHNSAVARMTTCSCTTMDGVAAKTNAASCFDIDAHLMILVLWQLISTYSTSTAHNQQQTENA